MTRDSGIKVVQVGEGADELFYGYDHWLRFMKVSKYFKPVVSHRSHLMDFKRHRFNLASNMLFNRTSFAGGALGFNLAELNHMIDGGVPQDSELIHYVDNKWDDYFQSKEAKLTKWMTLIDLQIRLPELLLMRMDKLTMQSGIEARVPFLDHKLVEYVLSIPEHVIFDTKTTKPLLKEVARKHLPAQIINRKKQGFRAPIGEWLKKDEQYFYESIREFNLIVNLFNEKEINRILAGNDFQKKWYLLNLARWHMMRVSN
jgi:asparagine synthase (glutamine-hydrolysing)